MKDIQAYRASVPSSLRHVLVPQARGLHEFLVFLLRSERMGLPLGSVQEILKYSSTTPVPRSPHDVIGIVSVRGRITTVIDLRRRLAMGEVAATRLSRVLLLDCGTEVVGVLVDSVLHVERLRDDEIEPASVIASDLPEHVLGLGRPRRRDTRTGTQESAASDVQDEDEENEVIVLLNPLALLR